MPKDKDEPNITAASDAVAEATAKPADLLQFDFNGATYSFRRKTFDGIRFRLALQEGADVVALRTLLGFEQFEALIAANGDEDGDMERAQLRGVYDAVSNAAGSGKSSSSSRR